MHSRIDHLLGDPEIPVMVNPNLGNHKRGMPIAHHPIPNSCFTSHFFSLSM
jgi:hypothetical protein